MGNDRANLPRKPRSGAKAPASKGNPFRATEASRDPGNLNDVPGLLGTVDAVCLGGGAILFARTRDGGAWAIQVLDGDERYKGYATDQDELNELFANVWAAYGADDTVS